MTGQKSVKLFDIEGARDLVFRRVVPYHIRNPMGGVVIVLGLFAIAAFLVALIGRVPAA